MSYTKSVLPLSVAIVFSVILQAATLHGQTGSFAVVLNEQSSFGDSMKSVTFYDTADLDSGPLFSVFTGFESATNVDDPNAIDVDPNTGDVYLIAYDSGIAGEEDAASNGLDTEGDYDILKINFATVYNHWETNFRGTDVRSLGGELAVGGPAPTGSKNSMNLDYVTYGPISDFPPFNFEVNHSNTFALPGSIEKIGEIKRNSGDGENFFQTSLEFINQDTLFLLDDSSEDASLDNASNDHSYRIIERVSTSPGAANDVVGDHLDGGFNRGTTESWNSRVIDLVNLDTVEGVPTGHSEPESTAFYEDSATGVRGVWVTESDGGGDDIAFLELDANGNSLGYRPHSTMGNPTSFALDNNPFVDATTNDGKADNILVDQDTGDLIIIESGFMDSTDGSIPAVDHEPSVIRREVVTYDNGSGQIQFGAWSEKVILNPQKTPGDDEFLERGQWAAYDSENDLAYFFGPGSGGETPEFEMDIWVLDVNTGATTSYLDLDDSVSLFFDPFGDKVDFFTLSEAADGDFDNDGDVDGSDFLLWQRGGSPNPLSASDLEAWMANYGTGTSQIAGVPEPASLALLALVMGCGVVCRRRG